MPFAVPLRAHRTALVVAVVAALVTGVLVVLALRDDGYESRHVDLNDGGVWVTSDKDGLFGRLNKPAGSLDLALNPPGGVQSTYRLDVRQSGAAVTAWDLGSGRLLPVDVASGRTDAAQAVPVSADEDVDLAGGTLAVLDPATGKVWATPVDTAESLSSLTAVDPSARPAVTFPKRSGAATGTAALAVGPDGAIHAVSGAGDVAVAVRSGAKYAKPSFSRVAGRLGSAQITVVGDSVVVLDATSGTLHLPGGRTVELGRDVDPRLQEPSDAGDAVVVATRTKLLSVPLAGGRPTTLFSGAAGRPAAPTWLGPCVHAAWAGQPGVYARSCDGAAAKQIALPRRADGTGALVNPVFRVNRGAILLNDLALGNVYDLDSLQQVDNWSAVKPPPKVKPSKDDKDNRDAVANRDLPPKAVDDRWGARPGRTTVLHVLDNDSDPQGAILSVNRVSGVSDPRARVAVAPDGQSVEVTLPPTDAQDVGFRYTIDDGKGLTAEADVRVQARLPGEDTRPALRYGFTQPSFTVSSGGRLDVPVLDDWRDFDGDPLVVPRASIGAGTVTVAPSGRLNVLAPVAGGGQTLTYEVSDGLSDAVAQRVPLTVLAPTSGKTAAPVANADIARGQVGRPITVDPLANDLPGADPTNPDAALGIAGAIASPAGVRVDTDLKSGTVTVVASRRGTFALRYTASFGNAKFDQAPIRVDVTDPPQTVAPPVAVPDTGVLYGQTAATADVLANDFDPAGGVLVVQRAIAADPDALQVSIVGGRFVRVAAKQPTLATNPQTVTYTITNGRTAPVTGTLTVTQVPAPADDTPLAVDDYAVVRSGDNALLPVLDNDIDPAGASLDLLDDVSGAPGSGALTVAGDDSSPKGADVGAAYVSGKQVRYAAPVVSRRTAVTVTYVAHNADGGRASGVAHVTVVPPPTAADPDQAPAAQPVTARAVSGQTVRITVPTTGIDPDGDTADVVGITSGPTLGRVIAIGSTSITYEAFPTTSGTDRFGYVVSDRFGRTSTSTVSVGVAQVSDPQPPVAVDDTVTAPPGAKVRVDVLANDVIAPDDSVSIGDLGASNPDLPAGVKRVAAAGPVQVLASPEDGRAVDVLYSVTDGAGDPSLATVTVRSQRGYVPPPSVVDVPAQPAPTATSVTVDVLAKATDPQQLPLSVAKVYDARATVSGGRVTLPVTSLPQNVVFAVRNTQGGTAAAVIHVPARGTGFPYVKAGSVIRVDENRSTTVSLADHVVNPRGKRLQLTTTDRLSAAPAAGLEVEGTDPTTLRVTATHDYVGPAAVTLEVTDGATLNDPNGRVATVTIPVQVGPDTPVVRCPTAPVTVVEGGADRRLDVASLCHVWVADRSRLSTLDYSASWSRQPKDVEVLGNGTGVIGLRAGTSAVPGETGALRVTVEGTKSEPSTINVRVLRLGRASMTPIRIDGFKAGSSVTRDIRGSVESPLRSPQVSVVRAVQSAGMPARVTLAGSRVTITPGRDSHGVMAFDLVATDVPDRTRTDRQFSGRITLEVLNVPDAPGAPQAGRTVLSQTVVLSWPAPAANGAPIDGYRVEWPGGAQTCAASPCRITGLTNGRTYAFTVRAHNAVGYSKPSPRLSPPARPDKLPAAVAGLRASDPQDGRVTLSWTPVANGGTAPRTYQLSWSGGGTASLPGTARSYVVRGLDNHNVYAFTVVAVNQLGAGPSTSTRGQSAGAPATPADVTVAYADAAGTDTRAVRVSWRDSDPNGPPPSTYTVTRDGAPICRATTATSCTDTPQSGRTYTYAVTATNGAGKASAAGRKSFDVAGTPDQPGNVKAQPTNNDGEVTLTYVSPNPRGKQARISCTSSTRGDCGTWTPPAAGQPDSRVISGLGNDTGVTITLVACNEQNYCSSGATSPSTHTNGPPGAPVGLDCTLSGTTITWNWDRPAAINGHRVDSFQISGDGSGTVTTTRYSKTFDDDGKPRTVTVRSVDDRGEPGGQDQATCDAKEPPPPVKDPSVTWDYSSDRVDGCQFHSGGGCPYVIIHGHDFPSASSCTVDWQPAGSKPGPRQTRTYTVGAGDSDTKSGAWYGYTAHIVIDCANGAHAEGTW